MNQMAEKHHNFHNQRFAGIQALRGILALFVVLEHIRFAACGAFAVDAFFCISGFMIMFSTHDDTKHFLAKRLIRILPLYYLMTIGTFLLLLMAPNMFETTSANAENLIKSLLFIPFDIGGGILQPLMRVGWTINCEFFFYLLFWVSFKISHKYRAAICSILLVVLVTISHTIPHNSVFLSFYGAPVMLDFIWGMLAYYVCRWMFVKWDVKKVNRDIHIEKGISILSLFLAIMLFVVLIATKTDIDTLSLQRPLYWGGAGFLLVLLFFMSELFGWKVPTSLVHLGNISFSLYLLHYYPVMFLGRAIFNFEYFDVKSIIGATLAICISVVAALLSYKLIENKFTKLLKKIILHQ